MRNLFVPALAAILTLIPSAQAQGWYYEWQSSLKDNEFGASLACAGDVDADGFVDLIVGAPGYSQNSTTPEYADVYSGRDGSLLHRFTWYGTNFPHYSRAVAGVGDVDADGHDDVAVGLPLAGFPQLPGGFDLFSGRDGSMLLQVREVETGGDALAGPGDLDGDGTPDVVVGSWHWSANPGMSPHQVGIVRAYSGKTGAKLGEVAGQNSFDRFGWSVAAIDDVDLDGTRDLVVGIPGWDQGLQLGVGRVQVHSGKTLQELYHVAGAGPEDELGFAVAGVGDVDGDGLEDFAAGAPQFDVTWPAHGYTRVYSGADGALIHHLVSPNWVSEMGTAVCGPGDMNGDGIPDVAVGAPGFSSGGASEWVDVFSGADGAAILSLVSNGDFGYSLAPVADVNADGLADLAIGARWSGGQRQGAAYVWAGGPGEGVFCQAKLSSQGCLPAIASSGTPSVTVGGFTVSADQIVNQRPGLLFWGLAPQLTPFKQGFKCVAAPSVRTPVQSSAGNPPPDDCSGSFTYAWTPGYLAGKGLSAGDAVYAQYWYLESAGSAGVGLTDALHFVLVP